MQLLITMASSMLLVHFALGSPYQFVRQCRSYTEPCGSWDCEAAQSNGTFPLLNTYGCCLGKIIDERKHACVRRNGVTLVEACNPCTEFQCGSGECKLAVWKCDRDKDCLDGSDELGCGSCGNNSFRCKNGRCVHKQHVCDKVNNCGDGSDEGKCLKPDGSRCGWNEYRCNNNKCIKLSRVCDGANDCGDSSDERHCRTSGKKRSKRWYLNLYDDDQENNKTEKANSKPIDASKPPIYRICSWGWRGRGMRAFRVD